MLGIDKGCIVNINDICGLKWLPLTSDLLHMPISPAYACSKSALTALTECLRVELANELPKNESNIKVIVSSFESRRNAHLLHINNRSYRSNVR